MWVTYSAMESELQLLRQGMEYAFNCVFWSPDDEWRGEWGEAQGGEEEHGAPEEVREGEETME